MVEVVMVRLSDGYRRKELVDDFVTNGNHLGILVYEDMFYIFSKDEDLLDKYMDEAFLGFNPSISLKAHKDSVENYLIKEFYDLISKNIANKSLVIEEFINPEFESGKTIQIRVDNFIVDELDYDCSSYRYSKSLYKAVNRLLYLRK